MQLPHELQRSRSNFICRADDERHVSPVKSRTVSFALALSCDGLPAGEWALYTEACLLLVPKSRSRRFENSHNLNRST